MTDSADSPESQGRAGRNLPAAIVSGIVLVVVALVSLFTIKWLFGIVVILALAVGVKEMTDVFANRNIRIERIPAYCAVVALPAVAYLCGPVWQLMAMGGILLLILLWRIPRGSTDYVRDVTASTFVVAYLPFMAGFVMLTLATDDGPWRVLVFLLLTVGNDVGGYVAGVLWGKHPIAPSISPKKSWEGLAGSLLLQVTLGCVAFVYLLDAPWWQGAIAGIVLTATATGGDLAESSMKRDLGVKDMSSVVPGHGGIMDRLDSLIPNAFASWALFTIFLGPTVVISGA